MAVGFEYQGVCYTSNLAATDAYFASFEPMMLLMSTTSAVRAELYSYRKLGSDWVLNKQQVISTGALTGSTTSTPLMPSFTSCNTLDFAQYDINPANILEVMGWGLGFVIFMWSLGYATSIATGLIKKV